MQRLRLSLQAAVVAVALAAVAFGGWRAYRSAGVAAGYFTMAKGLRSIASGFRQQAADPNTLAEIAADFQRDAEEMEAGARIYERAATRPWLPLTFKPESP